MVDITELENKLEKLVNKVFDDQVGRAVNELILSIPDPSTERDLNTKVRLLVLRSRALTLLPKFSKEAERDCTAALKLQHNRPDLWILLSECLERRNAIREACDALDNVLRIDAQNVPALCRYSRLQRYLSSDAKLPAADKRRCLEDSIARGKAAVAACVADAGAWHVYALALLSEALSNGVAVAGARRALQAMRQAARLAPGDPDVHFNMGTIEGLLGHFGGAAVSFLAVHKAHASRLRGCRKMLEDNLAVVERARSRMDSARRDGKRRFAALLARLPDSRALSELAGGTEAGGTEAGGTGAEVAPCRVAVGVMDLLSEPSMEPLVALAAEKSGEFALLLFYGVKRGSFKVNDVIFTLTFPNSTATRVHHVVPDIPLLGASALELNIMQVYVDIKTTMMNGSLIPPHMLDTPKMSSRLFV